MTESEFRKLLVREDYPEPVQVEWEPSKHLDTHTHDFAVCLLVTRGEFTLTTAEGSTTFHASDVCSLDVGVPHSEQAGPEGTSLLVGRK